MNSHLTQQQQMAHKTKLTALTIYISPSQKVTRFVMIKHDARGKAILSMDYLNKILGSIPRGTTFSVG